jgi:Radical SAM superfamily
MEQTFTVAVPKVFGVPITDKCHLRCHFCFNTDERFASATHMDLDEFKRIIDWAASQHIEFIDLTPTVGEALLIPNLGEYFDYLDASPIKQYTLITTLAHKNIEPLRNRPKLLLEVSLYGGNQAQYKETTGKDVFKLVRSNILTLSTQRINVLKRFPGDLTDSRLNVILRGMGNVKVLDFSSNRPLIIPFNSKIKKCKFMMEPLLTPNGISLCCIDYTYDEYIIGNIGDDVNLVYADIESTIKNKQLNCSTACGWYSPWTADQGLDER